MSVDAVTAATEAEIDRCAAEAKDRHAAICDRLGAMSQFVWPYVVRPQVESRIREREAWARLVKAESRQCQHRPDYESECESARAALRGLGVDVDAMLEET